MPNSPKERCYKDLKRRILAVVLRPGETLDEIKLCEAYGISRTPLREVFHRLAGDGLLSLAPNRGAQVASMEMSRLRVFFKTAPSLYTAVARQAARNRTEAQLAELRAIQADFRAATEACDVNASAVTNHKFHMLIGCMAANPYLQAALKCLLVDHTRLGQSFFAPDCKAEEDLVEAAASHHDAMIDAFADRDEEQSAALALEHWALSSDAIDQFLRPDPIILESVPED